MKKYLLNLFIAVDQFFNALLFGDPDETISSRAGKSFREGGKWGKWLVPIVQFFDRKPKHFERAIEEDEGKDQIK